MRSQYARLNDNIGRRIRHLNEKLNNTDSPTMQKGIQQQINNLKEFRSDLQQAKREGKADSGYLYEKEIEMKSSGNLSTRDKDIKERISKSEMDNMDEYEENNEYITQELRELIDDYKTMVGKYVGVSSNLLPQAIMLANRITDFKTRYSSIIDEATLNLVISMLDKLITATSAVRRPFAEAQTSRERNQFKDFGILQDL